MSPSALRPGCEYDISVFILKSDVRIEVTALLYDPSRSFSNRLASSTAYFTKAQPDVIKLKIPMEVPASSYKLKLILRGFQKTVVQEKMVKVKSKSMGLFIQTDKATYKAGDIVKFRVITVTPNLTPCDRNITVTITDPNQNIIEQWKDRTPVFGLFNSTLQLSNEPVLGLWKIIVKSHGQSNNKQFEVAEYVLPKFEVSVDLPNFYVADSQAEESSHLDFHFTVAAKYPYGQPVKGIAKVSIQLKPYAVYDQGHYIQKVITKEVSVNRIFKQIRRVLHKRPGILVSAEVTESASGLTLTGNDTMQITDMKYKLSFLATNPANYKPGLYYTGFLQLTQFDGSMPDVRDIANKICLVVGSYPYAQNTGSRRALTWSDTFAIPRNGLVKFSTLIGDEHTSVSFSVSTLGVRLHKQRTRINQYPLKGYNHQLRVPTDKHVTFDVHSTESISGFSYVLLSKGGIVYTDNHASSSPTTKHTIIIPMTPEMAHKLAPSGRLNIWYLTSTGEIVTDSLELKIEGAFLNEVELDFTEAEMKPRQINALNVQANPGSLIGVLAVDKRVLLLKQGNDLSKDEVLNTIPARNPVDLLEDRTPAKYSRFIHTKRKDWLLRWKIGVMNGRITEDETPATSGGGWFLSAFDARTFLQPRTSNIPGARVVFNIQPEGETELSHARTVSPDTPQRPLAQPALVRSHFPESWIWTELQLSDSGNATIECTVPDTITSWVATAFAMNQETGLGFSSPAEMTTFTPFFLSLNLPYSVIRGEEFALAVTVFNYLPTNQEVVVTLPHSPIRAFGTHRSANELVERYESVTRKLNVPANDAANAHFWIVPKNLGQISLKILAQSPAAADAVEKKLLVEAEGIEQEYSRVIPLNLNDQTKEIKAEVEITLPSKELVPESTFIYVTVIGDVMGPSINGLERLVRLPRGCGEQNMLNFAPNIYVLQYLEETNQDNSAIKRKCKDYMKTGYQRELNYQRNDGSFSAFGNRDVEGSTWLSAFVVRCFNQARPYITIDSDDVEVAINWIVQHQHNDGRFQEPGRVLHANMQGGGARGLAMTAYVALALMENDNTYINQRTRNSLKRAVARTVAHLESKVEDSLVQKDVFTMAILAYALQLANSPKRDHALSLLEDLASLHVDGTHLVVDEDDAVDPTNDGWRPPYHQAGASDIEATAYLLLNYVARGDILKSLDVAEWIVRQRNANGGFSSTQDTVVALQALAGFAALTNGENLNVDVTVSVGDFSHNFDTITWENSLTLQSVESPTDSRLITVNARGRGVAIAQVNVKFNVFNVGSKPELQLSVVSTDKPDASVEVEVCNAWTFNKSSGMVVTEMGLLSGHQAVAPKELIGQVNNLKRVEVTEQKIVFYFDEVSHLYSCLSMFIVTKPIEIIINPQPVQIATYSYYSPDKRVVQSYSMAETMKSTMCESCPDCCELLQQPLDLLHL
ncbi:hypothetical protein CAPTEDRAFT_165779 [Capitella teleta]|uniref:CD109 antigen n=1 Tax=Capitella teleta TaxID=283909 RepID=R7VGJ4_CAPTE|nr:hypothetical protein CAPTEDRAFT_165779 [Capitella teleta]|eukprot:ELU17719.1 hypothetical protein CAPTEDRAFT_165779 [Capitella teleta]